MTNATRVLKELSLIVEELRGQYRSDDVVAIGLRYSDRSVDKVECFFKEVAGRLFFIIDGRDPVCDEHKHANLLTIFVCDSSGTTIYDSQDYKPSKQKATLKLDGDRRLLAFKKLNLEEKDQVINLTCEQIWADIKDITLQDDVSKKISGAPDSAWGEMPWDFHQK